MADRLKLDSYTLREIEPSLEVQSIAKGGEGVRKVEPRDAVRLYHITTSTCSQRVRLAAAEKGVRFISHHMNYLTGELVSPNYLNINPRGVVPTWVDAEHVVFDSPTIIRFIDARYFGPDLRPADPAARSDVERWIDLGDAFPNRYLTYYSQYENVGFDIDRTDIGAMMPVIRPIWKQAARANPDIARLINLKLEDWGRLVDEIADEKLVSQNLAYASEQLDQLDQRLSEQAFICGDIYTIADTCWTTNLRRLFDLQSTNPEGRVWFSTNHRPNLDRYLKSICARDSFKSAYSDWYAKVRENMGVETMKHLDQTARNLARGG